MSNLLQPKPGGLVQTLSPRALAALLAVILIGGPAGAETSTTLNMPIVVTHQGSPVQTLLPMVQQPDATPFQFLAGAGSAHNLVGNIAPAAIFPASPPFAGTYSISGPDAGRFTIDRATGVIRIGASDVAAGTYHITVSATQAGVIGSPASEPVTLQGVDVNDTKTLFLQIDNYTPAPGGTVNVTVRNTPNSSGRDYVQVARNYNGLGYSNQDTRGVYYQYLTPAGTHKAVIPLTVPNPPIDSYQFLTVLLVPNDGQRSQATAKTSDLLIQPSIPFVMPTAPNTLVPPFVPSQILSVCPVGCQYTQLSRALIGLSNSNHSNTAKNVLITMQAGAYEDCQQFGNDSPFTAPTDDRIWHLPHHLWIKGIGGGFAHISTMDNPAYSCYSKGTIVFWGTPSDILTIDNLEISDWVNMAPSGAVYVGTGNVTLRNVYIHDGNMGLITGNHNLYHYIVQNSRFARGGGSAGPSHNVYVGSEASFSIDHSISEQSLVGHEVKTRAITSHVTCNQLRGSQDPYFIDSEEVNFAQATGNGMDSHLDNNTIVKGIGSTQQEQAGWATDFEGGHNPALLSQILVSNNIFIDDDPKTTHWFMYIGPGPYGSGMSIMSSPPNTWKNNIFVGGPLGNSDPHGSYPYAAFRLSPAGSQYPDPGQVTEIGDMQYATRAAAGITQMYPPPPGCTGTIGNIAVP